MKLTSYCFRICCLFVLSLLLSACAGRQTKVTYVEDVDFSALKYFAVKAGSSAQSSELKNQQFIAALTTALEEKGFELSTPEKADWIVNHYYYLESEHNNKNLSIGIGTGSRSRNTSISIGGIFQIPLGKPITDYQSIQIDMLIDGKVVWEGNGSIEIDLQNSQDLMEMPKKLVDKVLSDFPPNSKSG